MTPESIDLIDKLLQANPLDRLGYGPKGSNYDFAALKAHPFFDGLNFDDIKSGKLAPTVPVVGECILGELKEEFQGEETDRNLANLDRLDIITERSFE